MSCLANIEKQTGAFAIQIRNVLQMTMGDDDLMAARSIDIGFDSLISVDIRSWFLKKFEVSVPVLKIMGNDTMGELAELVAGQVPANLLPEAVESEAPTVATLPPNPMLKQAAPSSTERSVGEETGSSNVSDGVPEDTSADSSTGSTGFSTPARMKAQTGEIDWNAETALPEAAPMANATPPAVRPRVILLTGVTGLLGSHLLSQLLEDSSVVQIICIAVRRLSERLEAKELKEDDRILYFAGDLEQPRLGLSEEDAAQIFSHIDVVIHNGADTSHLKFYPAIAAANKGSTSELIRLTMAREVPIHYLSTVGVALFGNFLPSGFREISVVEFPPPADGSHGYVAAKWASERMLEELHRQHGINVWIHRPSTIIREGADAVNQAAALDWMIALVAYMLKTHAVPSIKNLRGALDFVYVMNVTSSILKCVFENKANGISYFNQVGDLVIPLDRLREFVAQSSGSMATVDVLSIDKWATRAVAAGLNRGIGALIESVDDPGMPHYPRMLKGVALLDAK